MQRPLPTHRPLTEVELLRIALKDAVAKLIDRTSDTHIVNDVTMMGQFHDALRDVYVAALERNAPHPPEDATTPNILEGAVNWVRWYRQQTGYGIREAKDVYLVRAAAARARQVVEQ